MTKLKYKVAMVGTKGIPAKWGGIEVYVQEISKRLAAKGHQVTVYGSKWYCNGDDGSVPPGVTVRTVNTLHYNATDAVSNAFLASLHILSDTYDVVHLHNYASYYFLPVLKKAGKRTLLTVHNIESAWDNPKYNSLAKEVLKKAFRTGIRHADAVTTVAHHLSEKLKMIYKRNSWVVPSGVETSFSAAQEITQRFGLKAGEYLLFLGRIDPIKRVDWIIEAAQTLPSDVKVAIAGGAQDNIAADYMKMLQDRAKGNERIVFTGPVTGRLKEEMLSNCRVFLSPSSNEGLPIAVLEAASHGRCCVVSDLDGHKAIIENSRSGFLFASEDKIQFFSAVNHVLGLPQDILDAIGNEARSKVVKSYNWDATTDIIETLYSDLARGRKRA